MPADNLPTPEVTHAETRHRLVAAAAEVFAERGFQNATIREISRRAATNIAAVNYHFGDKERLYTEVLRHGARQIDEQYPIQTGQPGLTPPSERLRLFIYSFLHRIFSCDRSAYHARLMTREMVEPTHALDAVVEEVIRPISKALESVVRELLRPEASECQVRNCCAGVVGQCVYFFHCRPMLIRLFPNQTYGPTDIEQLAAHITRFSLGGIAAAEQEADGELKKI